jgi:hypothetical protein
MLKPIVVLTAAAGLAACAQTPAETARAAQDAAATQAALAKELAGLVPKGQMACLPNRPTKHVEAYGKTILYTVSPRLKYRTETAGGCESLARGDILVTRSNGIGVCAGDISQTIDRTSHFPTGSCSFGEFTEYRRP